MLFGSKKKPTFSEMNSHHPLYSHGHGHHHHQQCGHGNSYTAQQQTPNINLNPYVLPKNVAAQNALHSLDDSLSTSQYNSMYAPNTPTTPGGVTVVVEGESGSGTNT